MSNDNFMKVFLEAYYLMHNYSTIWYRKNFSGMDPKQGQGRILSALRRNRTISQKELGLMLDIRPQSLGELLQKLENNGYITRHRSSADKRALIVELTAKGEFFQRQRPDYDKLFVDLNAKEKELLSQSLGKISKRLYEVIEDETADDFY